MICRQVFDDHFARFKALHVVNPVKGKMIEVLIDEKDDRKEIVIRIGRVSRIEIDDSSVYIHSNLARYGFEIKELRECDEGWLEYMLKQRLDNIVEDIIATLR